MKSGAIILCRTTSSRFPNKILKKIHNDISVLQYVIHSISQCDEVNEVIIATTYSKHSREIEIICERMGAKLYYGSENNVYDRFRGAALENDLDIVARINADCPFILPKVVDYCFSVARTKSCDYLATILHETFPIGLHVEILKCEIFKRIDQTLLSSAELEHVTPYIYNNPEIFSLHSVKYSKDCSDVRLTIDYPKDLEFCKKIAKKIDIKKSTSVSELLNVYYESIAENRYIALKKSQNILTQNTHIMTDLYHD